MGLQSYCLKDLAALTFSGF
uniref:Uncharacterized protein n=1 Tax=Arundo donax TaxID=35708 RepID=A0A0A8YUI6_ARUDO